MLKYSTYRSIYDKAPVVKSLDHNNEAGAVTITRRISERLFGGSVQLLHKELLIKLTLIIVLVISGLTIVGNVFASSASLLKEEKHIVVERGDTLWSIALKNKPADMKTIVYINGIMRSSGLETSQINAGDILTLPNY